jgi:UDP-glucose 4-epimerase
MKRVIITGGTGFVGANLSRRLLRDGHDVHLLVRRGFKSWRIDEIRDHIRLHEVDLGNMETLFKTVGEIRPEWVFHLATHGAYSWQNDAQTILQTNFQGTVNLVQACMKSEFETFVNTGTSSEYGFKRDAPSETEWLEPNSCYSVAKASATLFCRYAAQKHKARIFTLRLYSVYGPYEEPGRLMPTIIGRGLMDELPPLVNPEIARDYIYIDDVNEAYMLAATSTDQEVGAVYNVGTGVQTSVCEVVEVARRLLGITAEPKWKSMPNRQWDTDVWVSDSRRIRRELGWEPQHSFERGFELMVRWFRDHPEIRSQHYTYNP